MALSTMFSTFEISFVLFCQLLFNFPAFPLWFSAVLQVHFLTISLAITHIQDLFNLEEMNWLYPFLVFEKKRLFDISFKNFIFVCNIKQKCDQKNQSSYLVPNGL
jgi:membrane-bound metal-dependent hydrolase YbcI (DUF457 family)